MTPYYSVTKVIVSDYIVSHFSRSNIMIVDIMKREGKQFRTAHQAIEENGADVNAKTINMLTPVYFLCECQLGREQEIDRHDSASDLQSGGCRV